MPPGLGKGQQVTTGHKAGGADGGVGGRDGAKSQPGGGRGFSWREGRACDRRRGRGTLEKKCS